MDKLKELQGSLPWIVNGVPDDDYRLRGAELRDKLAPYKADIEGFFVGAGPDYTATFAILIGLDKLTFMKWAADEHVTLPGAGIVPRVRRSPGRPRAETKTSSEPAERIQPVVEKIQPQGQLSEPEVQPASSKPDSAPATATPGISGEPPPTELQASLAEALIPLKAQIEEIEKHRERAAVIAKFYALEEINAKELLEKYTELVELLEGYVKRSVFPDAGADV
jgi:hypothetical protein